MATPALRVRIAPKFPAKVQGTSGVVVDRTGGSMIVRQDWSNVQEGVLPADLDQFEGLYRNKDTGAYERVPMTAVVAQVGNFADEAEAIAGVIADQPVAPDTTKASILANAKDAEGLSSDGTFTAPQTIEEKIKLLGLASPEDANAPGDGTTDVRTRFYAYRDWAVANDRPAVLSPGQDYQLGDATIATLGSAVLNPGVGSAISGQFFFYSDYSWRTLAPLTINPSEAGTPYVPTVYSSKYRRPIAEKEQFLTDADADRSVHAALDCHGLIEEQILWPSATGGWTGTGPSGDVGDNYIGFLADPTKIYSASVETRCGEELSVRYSFGAYDRCLTMKTAMGSYVFQTDGIDGAGELFYIPEGGSPSLVTAIDWAGRAGLAAWQPLYADFSIFPITPDEFTIKVNGTTLFSSPLQVPAGDFITHVGAALTGTDGSLQRIIDPVLKRGGTSAGRGQLHILCAGDSRFATYPDDSAEKLKEILEGSCGLSVLKMENIAVAGWTTGTTLSTLTAHGYGHGESHLIYAAGTNDAQNQDTIDLDTVTTPNVEDAIDAAQAANIKVIVVLFPGWYSRSDAGGKGVNTYNDPHAARYRQRIRRIAASRGCKIVDLSQIAKPILPYEVNPGGDARYGGTYPTGMRDNIHWSAHIYNVAAMGIARAILSEWPAPSREISPRAIPSNFYKSSWSAGAYSPRIALSESGKGNISGLITAGTKSAGTTYLQIPASIAPLVTKYINLRSDNNAHIRVTLDPLGAFKLVDALGGGDTGLFLDGTEWQSR